MVRRPLAVDSSRAEPLAQRARQLHGLVRRRQGSGPCACCATRAIAAPACHRQVTARQTLVFHRRLDAARGLPGRTQTDTPAMCRLRCAPALRQTQQLRLRAFAAYVNSSPCPTRRQRWGDPSIPWDLPVAAVRPRVRQRRVAIARRRHVSTVGLANAFRYARCRNAPSRPRRAAR
jgi:hypothetical protein